ncbi:hypothetical protein [Halodesulfovibrio aestuarii]|uniref:Uncharacterized protein n=1 Tax=Halodesulfovibrio aestuarii TaxID=126333 RepID=A0A8G2C7C2_9BACT|nr:hypothetical protein [Halodesulfovibrio aestuarii]SHI61183.1 hypothetical protein SAMN05660830_00453 [Halodesulfovibrio aestuarii]
MLLNKKLININTPMKFGTTTGVAQGNCELIFEATAIDKSSYEQLTINDCYDFDHHGSILQATIQTKNSEDLSIKFRCSSKPS